jgi:hypothetical protein
MKFMLVFTICSIISGSCEPVTNINKTFDSWSECVGHGGKLIVDFSIDMKEHADKNKLYISYFCNEVKNVV